jgi:ornithine cyclodeaminase/alanine dehydrogenase
VSIVEKSLHEHGEKQVQNPPKLGIYPLPETFMNAMPAYLPRKNACGIKWVAGFPSNLPKGLPAITGVIIMNDPETGLPTAIMDGTYITALRTVCVSAISTRHLCNRDISVMAIVGCGVQGKYHAARLTQVVPSISTLKISDIYEPSIRSFLDIISKRLPSLKIEVCTNPEEAITNADLVVTATGRLLKPIFKSVWVKEGALVLPVHVQGWDSPTASQMDKLVVDDWAQFSIVGKKLYKPLPKEPHAELGEIVAGLKPGRENPKERIVDFNKGLAVHDILMGSIILSRAQEMGLGTELTLKKPDEQLLILD